jgi:superfamily II DNA or RNA helicase
VFYFPRVRERTLESFTNLSASSAREQPEILSSLGELLGVEINDLRVWLEHVHGRTKLPNALGRLWPAVPDQPRERLEMPADLGQTRNTEARRDAAVQLRLAQILGASLAVVEAALSEEHHRLRLDRCLFEACERAYLAAIERRSGEAVASTGNHRIAQPNFELSPKKGALQPSIFSEPPITRPTIRPPTDLSLIPGMQVRARGLSWTLVEVCPAGEATRFRVRCDEGSLRGREFDLLSPPDSIEALAAELDPTRPARLSDWLLYHRSFLLEQALGPHALLAAQPGRLDIAPYQLVPVMRALQMSRPRLMLADGVGLGKTVQAGLVMAELIARRRAHRILIVSPAGPLMAQWGIEMRTRFGLRFTPISRAGDLQDRRRELELGANPFDHIALCITSIDFAKQEKVLQDIERSTWDLVVVDEAHHCAKLGRGGDYEDSRRRRLAEVLAGRCDGLLLLTATPHDGFDPHFASLLELLDPSLLDARGGLRGDRYRRHVVRRLKRHIVDPETGAPQFKLREVTPVAVPFDRRSHPRYAAFHMALLQLVTPRLKAAIRQRRFGEVLAFVSLLKRSVSTALACRNTLIAVRERYSAMVDEGGEELESRKQRLRSMRQLRTRLERYGALSPEEQQDYAQLEAEDMAADLFEAKPSDLNDDIGELKRVAELTRRRLRKVEAMRAALDELVEVAEDAASEDPKLTALRAELRRIRGATPRANVLVYTEYTDTQDEAREVVKAALGQGELSGEVLTICGDDDENTRTRITERFSNEDDLILISTDATAEGLNLHARCHHLVHIELPYNPNRLEQRNGRIDRYGQRHAPKISYLYLAGTFEERLLLRLIAKYERQQARLQVVPDTLGRLTTSDDATTAKLLQGLADDGMHLFERSAHEVSFDPDAPPIEDDDAIHGALLSEVEQTLRGFTQTARSQAWLGDAGLNAQASLGADAERARAEGSRLSAVDLLDFVSQAIELRQRVADAVVHGEDGVVTLQLPDQGWAHGLIDLPGFEAQGAGCIRLTSNRTLTQDTEGRSVGYLGRAHPLVRRALDRVRALRYGEAREYVDRRIAVVADRDEPTLLCTFVGGVDNALGRVFERVIAVEVGAKGEPIVHTDASEWEPELAATRGVPGRDLWKQRFAPWGDAARDVALAAAAEAFAPLAEGFIAEHRRSLALEREDLAAWLRDQAAAICGPVQAQTELYADGNADGSAGWRSEVNPRLRLAGFAVDGRQPTRQRSEAQTILSLHDARIREIDTRADVDIRSPAPLGLVMRIPAKGR